MNKKASLPNNKTASPCNAKQEETPTEPQKKNTHDNGKTKITPMSKDPLMGIF